MSVCLLAISDGRHAYHQASLQSALERLPRFDAHVFVDDPDHRLGFDGAVREGWRRALQAGCDHVFHLELDFTFRRPIPVDRMIAVLDDHPYLAQIALVRQPWNAAERAAGGLAAYLSDDLRRVEDRGDRWMEHRRYFTTNPSVYPAWVARRGWPAGAESEGRFGVELFRSHPDLCSALWGTGEEWVTHIGDERAGKGY